MSPAPVPAAGVAGTGPGSARPTTGDATEETSGESPDVVARVMVDSPVPQLDRPFDYRVPDALRDEIAVGVRVRVPLRSAGRVADGYVLELTGRGGYTGVLSEIESIVSAVPVLAPEIATLARSAADRAAGSAIDIVRLAVPTRQVRVEKAWLARAASDVAEPVLPPATPASLAGYPAGAIESAISSKARVAVDAVPFVRQVGDDTWVGGWAPTMAAAATIALAAGTSAILAVPDFRDQEQLMAALGAVVLPERIIRLDARQSNPDRYRGLLRALDGNPVVIVGNRSVIYAPASKLGLIAIWDDGDPLFSEPLAPYVHARDAALLRQQQQDCALLFFGNSRSTEVERLVEIGWVAEISPSPVIAPKVIPTAGQATTDRLAAQARIPSSAWREAKAALESGPVLVQVASPGYSPRLACVDCGQSARCLRCEGPLQRRSATSVPACAWCGALAVDWRCSHCDGTAFKPVGAAGASRTAEDLGKAFPGVRVIVADGNRPILTVGSEPALVIATRGAEPIASGGYRAVLLLDGERMVARESLRVGEDCLRWWSNAIALGAPGAKSLLVGVGGALASALTTWHQSAYARIELADRRRLRFPPAVRVATVTGPTEVVSEAITRAIDVPPTDILGPVDTGQGTVRTIIRFDYAIGTELAAALRAEVIRSATTRRKAAAGRAGGPAPGASLRVRFDDSEPFQE